MSVSKTKYIPVAKVSEIPPGAARTFDVGDLSLAIANVGGTFFAIDNLCTHDDGPLGDGQLDGMAIECPRHGARFDVRTGAVLSMPAAFPVKSYPTRVEGDQVMVEVEE